MSVNAPRFASSCCSGGAESSPAKNSFAGKTKATSPVARTAKLDSVHFGNGEADKVVVEAEKATAQAKSKFKRYAGPGLAIAAGVAITVLTGGLFHFIGIPIAIAGIYYAYQAHKNKFKA